MGAKISREILQQRTENKEQPSEQDYDQRAVRKFIRNGQLAPCYEGKAVTINNNKKNKNLKTKYSNFCCYLGLHEPLATVTINDTPRMSVHKYPFIPWELPSRHTNSIPSRSDTDQTIECPICLTVNIIILFIFLSIEMRYRRRIN